MDYKYIKNEFEKIIKENKSLLKKEINKDESLNDLVNKTKNLISKMHNTINFIDKSSIPDDIPIEELKYAPDFLKNENIYIKLKTLNNDLQLLKDSIQNISLIQFLYLNKPNCSNDIVDLYKDSSSNDNIKGHYYICLHNSKQKVGDMSFGDAAYDDNVGCYIDDKYQNKGIGFSATCTFLEYLSSNNCESITLHARLDNVRSRWIAEKLGKIYPLKSVEEGGASIAYHFDISKKLVDENKNTK